MINSKSLRELLAERGDKITLLDVREPEEFEEDHLPGCKLIPLGDLMSRANRELDPDAEIVIYCAHGVRSMHALMGLRSLGYEKLRSLEGGLSAYREEA
ncbi:MAG: rhodanese-like domain-containing protein [Cryobacterium sp.]|nr:rhodanese-like domain-containing protein [Oligoflexia bacterium]